MKLIQVVLLKNVIGCIERIQIVKKEYIPLFHQMIYVKNLTPSHFIKYIFYMLKHNLNLMEEQKVFNYRNDDVNIFPIFPAITPIIPIVTLKIFVG